MTSKKEVQHRVLLTDVKQWMRGKYPQPVHLATAPTLEEWDVVWICADDGQSMRIQGIISGSPSKDDGDLVRTTPVVLLDRHFEWCRTGNLIYRLGQQAGVDIPVEGIAW